MSLNIIPRSQMNRHVRSGRPGELHVVVDERGPRLVPVRQRVLLHRPAAVPPAASGARIVAESPWTAPMAVTR